MSRLLPHPPAALAAPAVEPPATTYVPQPDSLPARANGARRQCQECSLRYLSKAEQVWCEAAALCDQQLLAEAWHKLNGLNLDGEYSRERQLERKVNVGLALQLLRDVRDAAPGASAAAAASAFGMAFESVRHVLTHMTSGREEARKNLRELVAIYLTALVPVDRTGKPLWAQVDSVPKLIEAARILLLIPFALSEADFPCEDGDETIAHFAAVCQRLIALGEPGASRELAHDLLTLEDGDAKDGGRGLSRFHRIVAECSELLADLPTANAA